MSDVGERVKKIVVEHLGVEPDKVTDNASFIDDLGADSLDTVELVMAFEEEFGCEIPDDAAETVLTVGDATQFLKKNAKSARPRAGSMKPEGPCSPATGFWLSAATLERWSLEYEAGCRHGPRHGLATGLRRRTDLEAHPQQRKRRDKDRNSPRV